ncbi:MAG: hypothetical protein RH917_02010 [Lacipirellulaceae bacterium]
MADESEQVEDAPKPKSGMITLVKALAFVSVVVLLEIAAASILIPDAEATQAIAEELAEAKQEDLEAVEDDEGETEVDDETSPLGDMVEVHLGAHHIRHTSAETGSSLNVNFDLWGTVLADEASEFDELYTTNQQRIAEQVTITVRGMEVTDFADPSLDLIKRKILEKTNRALGKPLLHDALIVDFSFVER